MEKIKLITRLINREMSAHEFIIYCKKIIINLKNTFPYLKVVGTWDDITNSKIFFDNDLSDFSDQNLKKILIYNEAEDVFLNSDQNDKNLHHSSKSWIGFNTLLYLSRDNNENSDFSINITQGAYEKSKTALINIEFSDEFLVNFTKESGIKLIESLENTGDLYYAVIISNDFRRKVKQSGQNLWIGYLTYFQNKIAENYYKNFNVIHLNGGIIFCLSDKMEISELNINKALEIRNILGTDVLNYNP